MEAYGDLQAIEKVKDWVSAAMEDGWKFGQFLLHEPMNTACLLTKDGLHAVAIMRISEDPSIKHEAKLGIWDREGRTFAPPFPYSMASILEGVNTCQECGKRNCKTVRVGFATKACEDCALKLRPQLERPGKFLPWND